MIKKATAQLFLNSSEILRGEGVKKYTKKVNELASVFLNSEMAKENDEVAYEVYSINISEDNDESLQYGVTVLKPVTVDGECVLTRGHFHADSSYGEVYLGLSGEGFLLKWDGNEEVVLEKVIPGSVHIIDGKEAHRLINIGETNLSVGAIWSKNAGYDYNTIEERGFPVRVFKNNGQIEIRGKNGEKREC